MRYEWSPDKNEWLKRERTVSNMDREEQELLDAYDRGVLKTTTPSRQEIDRIKAMARNTFRKDRRITIRLYEHE
jgi:hypothetical protein